MKNKRRLFTVAVALLMLLLLAGCDLDKKIGKSITEGILDKVADESGEDIDFDINGDDFTISTDEGEMTFDDEGGFTIEGEDGDVVFDEDSGLTYEGEDGEVMSISEKDEWPEGLAADELPKLEKGVVTYSMNLSSGCMIIVEEVELKDYTDYIEELKDMGFTNNAFETVADDMSAYGANLEGETGIVVYYYKADNSISITLSLEESN